MVIRNRVILCMILLGILSLKNYLMQNIEFPKESRKLRKRFRSNILVTGCGFKFQGLGAWLQTSVKDLYADRLKKIVNKMETDGIYYTYYSN